jgi:hypothetical protein
MARLFYILGVCAMLAAGGVLGLWLKGRGRAHAELEEILSRSDAIQRFRAEGSGPGLHPTKDPPLLVQAQALAQYLNPPKALDKPSAPVLAANAAPPVPTIRPAAPSAKFTLHGTSYYPNQPGRSMALIAELGSDPGNERWVKEGAQVGHFVIHEIRRGVIVYRDGDTLREMAVEHSASLPSIVRDLRPGSVRVSAAVGGTDNVAPALAGPNGIEIAGGN